MCVEEKEISKIFERFWSKQAHHCLTERKKNMLKIFVLHVFLLS